MERAISLRAESARSPTRSLEALRRPTQPSRADQQAARCSRRVSHRQGPIDGPRAGSNAALPAAPDDADPGFGRGCGRPGVVVSGAASRPRRVGSGSERRVSQRSPREASPPQEGVSITRRVRRRSDVLTAVGVTVTLSVREVAHRTRRAPIVRRCQQEGVRHDTGSAVGPDVGRVDRHVGRGFRRR